MRGAGPVPRSPGAPHTALHSSPASPTWQAARGLVASGHLCPCLPNAALPLTEGPASLSVCRPFLKVYQAMRPVYTSGI